MTLAIIERARGVRGEVTADPLGSRPERFEEIQNTFLVSPNEVAKPVDIEKVWMHDGRLVFKFGGVETRDDAEALRGLELRIPLSDRPPAPEGTYYQSDLVGCEVVEINGNRLGVVTGWQDYGAAGLLEVGELMIPFARSICIEVDMAARRIVVALPEGLKG